VATLDDNDYLNLHLFSQGSIEVPSRNGGTTQITVDTDYPWDGRIKVTIPEDAALRGVRIRVPEWCKQPAIHQNEQQARVKGHFVECELVGMPSKVTLDVEYPMPVRFICASTRVDAVRGCISVARGPLVYAVEQLDIPGSSRVEDLRIEANQKMILRRNNRIGGVPAVTLQTEFTSEKVKDSEGDSLLYCDATEGSVPESQSRKKESVLAQLIPYFLWGNRICESPAMRVWIPEDK
jgi:DUF1680 family protein